jgi:DNA-binding MarR family transcriptional regulator
MSKRDLADDIQAAWRRERPDLDVQSIGILTRIVRIARHLQRTREEELRAIGTDSVTLDVLATLRRAGPPYRLTAGDLQRSALVTAGAISQRLQKLEVAGLLRRRPDPRDGRQVRVQLTEAGIRESNRIVEELMRRETQLLVGVSPKDRKPLEALLRRWLLRLEPNDASIRYQRALGTRTAR